MKILIVSAAFYPDNSPRSFRTTELAKELAKRDYDVTVITPSNKDIHPTLEAKWNIKIKNKVNPSGAYSISGKIGKVINKVLEIGIDYPDCRYLAWSRNVLQDEIGYDLLITIAAPHAIHWGTAKIYMKRNKQLAKVWIADCGDPYMGGKMNKIPKMPWFAYFEKMFCKWCTYITVPVESAKSAYYSSYQEKINVIPQGFKFEDSLSLIADYTPNPIPTFAYAGSISPKMRDPRPLMKYLNSLEQDFKFYIYTNFPGMVQDIAKDSNGRIELRAYVPRTELLQTLSKMDFLINIENEVVEQVPSKLIDYHLLGRPVLSINSKSDFKQKVLPFLQGNYNGSWKLSNPDSYRIENVTDQFINLYHNATK